MLWIEAGWKSSYDCSVLHFTTRLVMTAWPFFGATSLLHKIEIIKSGYLAIMLVLLLSSSCTTSSCPLKETLYCFNVMVQYLTDVPENISTTIFCLNNKRKSYGFVSLKFVISLSEFWLYASMYVALPLFLPRLMLPKLRQSILRFGSCLHHPATALAYDWYNYSIRRRNFFFGRIWLS